jgi:hypothetical protein
MTDNDYLLAILKDQNLDPAGTELADLKKHGDEIEALLREHFGCGPVIITGGSVAKGTLNRELYDLDKHFYFANDDEQAGRTLLEIYESVAELLESQHVIHRKRSAIRLQTRNDDGTFNDLGVDVVPGRFQNGSSGDVYLYQSEGEKGRLQTNIQTQIDHVKFSGVIEVIRLLKLWRVRHKLDAKTFVLELLVIEILKDKKHEHLADQFICVLKTFSNGFVGIAIEDPANPYGNDLSLIFSDVVKAAIMKAAHETLEQIDKQGLQSVFGKPQCDSLINSIPSTADRLHEIAARSAHRSQPWATG